jgi:lipid-binding SYLF domain-containing protein
MNKMRLTVLLAGALALIPVSSSVSSAKDKDEKENDRLQNAGTVMKEIMDVPDNIPQDLMDKARCVIVFPSVVKAAFVVGGSYGRGAMVCRTGSEFTGPWGAPAMMALEAGSVGFQIGGQATDFVILVMNNRGVDSLLHSKVKLGADASVAAGPKGRGAFAGVSLEGSTLRPDEDANRRLYGGDTTASHIITEGKIEAPASAHDLLSTLQKDSPRLKP